MQHTGYRIQESKDANARIQDAQDRGYWIHTLSSQPGGPCKQGPADYTYSNIYLSWARARAGPMRSVGGSLARPRLATPQRGEERGEDFKAEDRAT